MKRKIWVAVGVFVLICIISVAVYQSQFANTKTVLSAEEITERIQEQHPGNVLEATQNDQDSSVYDVIIESEDIQYYLTVDGLNGNILKMESEEKEAEKSEIPPDPLDDEEKEQSPVEEKAETETEEKKEVIGVEHAKEIALNQFAGNVVDIELDDDDGRLIYEIEVESSRGEADIEIDAYTGEVIVVDLDLDD